MTQISIPASLKFYFESSGNFEAIEILVHKVGGNTDRHDMNWTDLAAYHKSLLAAYQIQVDLWLFYQDLWEIIWGPVVKDPTPKNHEYEGGRSLANVWVNSYYRLQEHENGWLYTYVYTDGEFLRISFYFDQGGDCEQTNQLHLDSRYWEDDPSDDERCSIKSLVQVRSKTELDVTVLTEAAKAAMACFEAEAD